MQKIALLLCVLYIIYLLRVDSKRANVSSVLWIPLAWFLIIGSKPVARWLNLSSENISVSGMEDGNPIDRTIFVALTIIGILVLFLRKIDWAQLLKKNSYIFIFFTFSLISILWSEYQYVAMKRWIKDVGNIVMVMLVLTDRDPNQSLKALIRRFSYVLIPLSIILIKYYPGIGRVYHSQTGEMMALGVTTHKNSLGALCVICGMYFFWMLIARGDNDGIPAQIRKKDFRINVFFLLMTIWLMIKANSATAMICSLLGISIMISLNLPRVRKNTNSLGIIVVVTSIVFLVSEWLFNVSEIIVQLFGKDMTLTDRTLLWRDCLDLVKNPLVGTGYDSFWLGQRLAIMWEKWWWNPTQSHNGYLETYLNLGWLGVIILIGLIVVTFRHIKNVLTFDFELGRFRITWLVIALIYNYTEAAFRGLSQIWFVFLLIALNSPRQLTSEALRYK